MTRCKAKGKSYIGGDSKVMVNVDVSSLDADTGKVDIDSDGEMSDVNPLGSLQLFGLKQGEDRTSLTVTLTVGENVTTIEAEPDFSTNAWYDVDRQTLIVRNIGLDWSDCVVGCPEFMKWTFS